MIVYLLVHANSNVPIIAYENKEDCLKKKERLEKQENRLEKKGLLPKDKKGLYSIKVIRLRRRKKRKETENAIHN